MEWLSGDDLEPARFPGCDRCPYRSLARPEVCRSCLAESLPEAAGPLCPTCEQVLGPDRRCRNNWCDRVDRWWSVVWAIGLHAGSLRAAIVAYKYRDQRWWAQIFGRLLVGYLDEHMPWFDGYDLLVPMPAYLGAGARRTWDPVGRLVSVAESLAGARWPVAWDVIQKTAETPPMAGVGLGRRRHRAEGALRRSLQIDHPERLAGARVLVIDDVFTEGSTLREVARALLTAGATEVAGLALTRQPWGARSGHEPPHGA